MSVAAGQAAGKADGSVDWIVMSQSVIGPLFIANIHESILAIRCLLRIRRVRQCSPTGGGCAWWRGLLARGQGDRCME